MVPNKPATSITWFEAAKFVNWLNTSSGFSPAYKFDAAGNFQLWQPSDPGYVPGSMFRNSLAKYVLPSVDEWYKAAYYDPVAGIYYQYPTGSNTPPTPVVSGTASGTAVYRLLTPADIIEAGGLSPYGTMAQGGNVYEWNETVLTRIRCNAQSRRPTFAAAITHFFELASFLWADHSSPKDQCGLSSRQCGS